MRWDSRHGRGITGRGKGRWTGNAMPVQRTAVKADVFSGLRCAPRRAEQPASAGGRSGTGGEDENLDRRRIT